MTLSFGGGAGVLTIPGVSSDGNNGLVVERALSVAATDAQTQQIFNQLNGLTNVNTYDPDLTASNGTMQVSQQGTATGDNQAWVVLDVVRQVTRAGHTTPVAVLRVELGSSVGLGIADPTDLLALFAVQTVQMAGINAAGGLALFGKTPIPTAPRTLAQATITAITDANAKAAVQAIANALSDMGALTLT